jgi:dynein light chain Tctex-type 1
MADQFEFPPLSKSVHNIVYDVTSSVLEGRQYQAGKTSEWIESIGSTVLNQLKGNVSPNFKYIVSTIIVQKIGAGLHYESSALWDATTDGSVTVKFENETMICICTVVGVAI